MGGYVSAEVPGLDAQPPLGRQELSELLRAALATHGLSTGRRLEGLGNDGREVLLPHDAVRGVDPQGRLCVVRVYGPLSAQRRRELLTYAGTVRALAHPHLEPVLDVVELGEGWVAITCELIESVTLSTLLASEHVLPRSWLLALIVGVAEGLGALARAGYAHGDVCPDNIVVTPSGTPVLVDLFGSVRLGEYGTVPWAAPERDSSAVASPAGDVYSLAAVAWTATRDAPAARALLRESIDAARQRDPARRPTAAQLAIHWRQWAAAQPQPLPEHLRARAAVTVAARRTPTRRPLVRATRRGGVRGRAVGPGVVGAGLVGAGADGGRTGYDGERERGEGSSARGVAGAGAADRAAARSAPRAERRADRRAVCARAPQWDASEHVGAVARIVGTCVILASLVVAASVAGLSVLG